MAQDDRNITASQEPKHHGPKDPPLVPNIIRYHLAKQKGGGDNFSDPIPVGADAIAAYESARDTKTFLGQPVRALALIANARKDGDSSYLGGTQVAAWSEEGGTDEPEGWKEHVGGLPTDESAKQG